MPTIQSVFGSLPHAQISGIGFVGMTGYSFDGAGTRNRHHRIRIDLLGSGGGFFPSIATASFELAVEVVFEPERRDIVAMLADWSTGPQSGDFGADLPREVHRRLDDRLGTSFVLGTIPDANDGNPIAVLSVKSMATGEVNVYIEPANSITHWAVLNEVKVGDVLRETVATPNP
jgi:hypothetical protein